METLFLGMSGKVICLNKLDGKEQWVTKIKRSSLSNVYAEGDRVYAYSGGYMYCLDANNGAILWENPLKGFGYGNCIIATNQQAGQAATVSSQHAAQQSAALAAGVVATSSSGNAN